MVGPSHPIVEEAVVPLHDALMVVDASAPVSSTPAGRPIRSNHNRLPARYCDMLPGGPTCNDLPETRKMSPPPPPQTTELVTSSSVSIVVPQSAPVPVTSRTVPNSFSIFREYADRLPDCDPDTDLLLDDLLVSSNDNPLGDTDSVPGVNNPYAPYPNHSSYLLGDWFWSDSNTKTRADLKRLVRTLQDPDFNNTDLLRMNWDKVDSQLGDSGPDNIFKASDGWCCTSVMIKVPVGKGLGQWSILSSHQRSCSQVCPHSMCIMCLVILN